MGMAVVTLKTSAPQGSTVFPRHQNAPSDESLIRAIAIGDKEAMLALYNRHNVPVYRFVARLVRDRYLAENLVNDVFLEIWRHAERFEGRSKVSTWLLAIARHRALAVLRRRPSDRAPYAVIDEDNNRRIEDPSDNPEDSILKKDRGEMIRACMNELSREHREIIDLIYYHEKSVEEVAEILQVPKNTVKTRTHYARKRMAQLLTAREDFDRHEALQAA